MIGDRTFFLGPWEICQSTIHSDNLFVSCRVHKHQTDERTTTDRQTDRQTLTCKPSILIQGVPESNDLMKFSNVIFHIKLHWEKYIWIFPVFYRNSTSGGRKEESLLVEKKYILLQKWNKRMKNKIIYFFL